MKAEERPITELEEIAEAAEGHALKAHRLLEPSANDTPAHRSHKVIEAQAHALTSLALVGSAMLKEANDL